MSLMIARFIAAFNFCRPIANQKRAPLATAEKCVKELVGSWLKLPEFYETDSGSAACGSQIGRLRDVLRG